jgi:PAS domain S-box-containing protein
MTDTGSQSSKTGISVLYVDNEEDLLSLGKTLLEHSGEFKVDTLTSAQEALNSFQTRSYDAIVSGCQMPGMDGIALLKIVREHIGDVLLILLLDRGHEKIVIEAINNGADFYLQKGGDPEILYATISHQIKWAVQRKQTETALRESEEKFRRFTENAQDLLFRQSLPDGKFEFISLASIELTGYTPDEFYADPDLYNRLIHKPGSYYFNERFRDLHENIVPQIFEYQIIDRSGKTRWFNQRNVLVTDEHGNPIAVEGIITDVTHQKNIEHKLMRSEQRFLAATLNTRSLIWEIDCEGMLTYLSPAIEDILGYRPEEIIRKVPFFNFFDQPDRKEQKEAAMEILNSYESFRDFVSVCPHKNGSPVIVKTSGTPVFDEEGTFSGYCGVVQDITKEKEAEKKLVESEARYRLFADNVHDVIWTTDEKMRPNYVSPSINAFIGLAPKEATEMTISEFLTPDSSLKMIQSQKQWLDTILYGGSLPEKIVLEFEFLCKDGSTVWAETIVTPIYDKNQKFSGVVGVTRDISLKRQAEEAFRDNQQILYDAMDLANLVNWEYDVIKDIFTFDDRFYALYGTTAEREGGNQMSSKTYAREFVHPGDIDLVAEEVQNAIYTTDPDYLADREHRIIRRDGEIRYISVRIRITKDAQGRTIKTHGVNQDITERKKSEEALRRANRQLSLLTSITRHDILNNVALGLLYLDDAVLKCKDVDLSGNLEKILSSIEGIQSQIEFTRIYEDLGIQEPQWVKLDSVMPRSSLPDTITLNENLQDIAIFADPMLGNVFFNLLHNSVQHGQGVTEIQVSVHESGNDMTVMWEDNGVGIVEEEKEKIFERGFGKNTGLGMFLVREILSLTGISIRETGVPGKGALFEILVPKGAYRYQC